ncbi:MAG: VCBS repeat-containing protein [Planctomycetes bacterium]|nr:VCBS repeat-containing protein [Planctomycetota bacterium]
MPQNPTSLWQRLAQRWLSQSKRNPIRKQAPLRLNCESLEGRCVPAGLSIFAVGNAGGSVRIVDTTTGAVTTTFRPLDAGTTQYKGVVGVALGDFDADGINDVAVAATDPAGVNGLVASKAGKVFVYSGVALATGTAPSPIRTFTPFANHDGPDGTSGAYTNGLNIDAGDVNGDDHVDLVVGSRGGNGTTSGQKEIGRFVVIDGTSPAGSNIILGGVQKPFGAGYQKGVFVALGNVDGSGGDEIAVTRGAPVANPNLAVQQVKFKVYQLQGTTLAELHLSADGSTAFSPFASLGGPANAINRDSRVTFTDSNGDGKSELVFSALDPLTNATNSQVRVGVYSITPTAAIGGASIVSTGSDAGTYLAGSNVTDHAITAVPGTTQSLAATTTSAATPQNLALLTKGSTSGIKYLSPLTGAVQTGGSNLSVADGGSTLDGTLGEYVSPYTITGVNTASIASALNTAETSTPPISQSSWFDKNAYGNVVDQKYGPTPQSLAPTLGDTPDQAVTTTYIQRVLATEKALVGTIYQHHHDPIWNPYANGFTTDSSASDYWPWIPVNIQRGTAGIDCTNTTALAYSVGAGIHLNSSTDEQALTDQATDGNSNYIGTDPPRWNSTVPKAISPQFILGPNFAFDATNTTDYITAANAAGSIDTSKFQPGDILYMANNPGPTPASQTPTGTTASGSTTLTLDSALGNASVKGWTVTGPGIAAGTTISAIQGTTITLSSAAGIGAGAGTFTLTAPPHVISHAIMWLGTYGTLVNGQPSTVPLICSSHDNSPPVMDANGIVPTPGVHILPFEPGNWFYDNYSFAMRVLPTLT